MAAKIDRALNLIIPLDSEKHGRLYIHSTPISRDIYKANYRVLARTFAQMQADGVTVAAGPGIARLALESVSREMGQSERDPEGIWPHVQREVVNEIIRLTNVAVPTADKGYESMPLSTAYAREIFDTEDRDNIEGTLAFFCLEASLHPRDLATAMLSHVGGMWGFRVTSLRFTEFLSSLPISKPGESTGVVPAQDLPVVRLASVPR